MVDEFIRKQDAVDMCGGYGCLAHLMSTIKPADVVQVIRCGQCKYWQDNDGDYGYCYAKDGHGFGHAWGKNDFCSYGKMR